MSRAASAQTVEAKVPPTLERNMSGDGFNVGDFRPEPLATSEAETASRIVIMNYYGDVPAAQAMHVEHWDIGPGVTLDYQKAKGEIAERIDALVNSIQKEKNSE
jgi:hypothetical protein